MKLETLNESRIAATEKWRDYVAAEKIYRKPEFRDLKKVYAQLKNGKKLIDIFKIIARGGVHENHHPKLAIAKVQTKTIICHYYNDGNVRYINQNSRWGSPVEKVHDVSLNACLPVYDRNIVLPKNQSWNNRLQLEAPVPIVPAEHMPKKLTDDYYILWEVDVWKMVPPTDPWLLRRITKTIFVVVAGWDLTEIEKSVMHGRMY